MSFQVLATDNFVVIDKSLMKYDFDFLPNVPQSFVESKREKIELGLDLKKVKLNYLEGDMALILNRAEEPKDISLNTNKKTLTAAYLVNKKDYVYISSSRQQAAPQSFKCYEHKSFIIGSCESSNISITSNNPKYDDLLPNIIKIDGFSKYYGLGFKKFYQNFWIYSSHIELITTKYNYSWISPLEDITSPFILNLSINGNLLGDSLNNAIQSLPQRNSWKSNQINLGANQKFIILKNINLITQYEAIFINFSNYSKLQNEPNYNLRVKIGLEFENNFSNIMLYGDAYLHNLLGFEHLTFNQRTEKYFEKPYGELGVSLQIKF